MDIPGIISVMAGSLPGKELVVMVGTHGDEPCGVSMLQERLPDIQVKKGRVTFIEGNPKALEANVRYTEQNLNRMFRAEETYTDREKDSYEFKRAQELKPLLASCDALLDIHSSFTKDTVPFVICEPNSSYLVEKFPFDIVSYGFDGIEPGGTDNFVNEQGGNGICVECGYHTDPSATQRAWESLKDFLILNEAMEGNLSPARKQKVLDANYLYKTKNNFTLVKYFADFEPVLQGDLIGTDGETEVYAPKEGVIIFARNRTGGGEEAFIVAEVV